MLHAHGLRAQQPLSFAPHTTDSDPVVRAAPNRLLGQLPPNRRWVGDITYLPRQGGSWLYPTVWLNRDSCKIVSFDASAAARRTCATTPEDLVSAALLRDSELAVQEIASRLGFTEPAHFSTYFKKHTHVSPLQYRRENQLPPA